MLVEMLAFLHHGTTLLFGIYVSALFLGIRMNRKNIISLFGFACGVGLIYILTYVRFGTDGTERLYPLIIHLPLVLFLHFFYKQRTALSVLSMLTAYLCCQISNWVGLAAVNLIQLEWVYYSVRIVVTIVVFIWLCFISDTLMQLAQKPTKSILIFGFMPFVYYLFDYATNVYTELLYSGLEVVVEFLGFALCIAYILFLILYFRQYEEKCEAERVSQMVKMQWEQSAREIEAIHRSEHTISLLRHDMRHFLANISTFIDNGETEGAQSYIRELIDNTEKAAMRKYCKNEIVNMILSSYERKVRNNEIDFQYSIWIPEKLQFSDVDITAILSNGLENAIQAVLPLEPCKRYIKFDLRMNDNKLLLSIKNTFAEEPVFRDGMPQSKESGHGLGTQSIRHVAEKLKGNCQFSVDGNLFVLQVIL